MRLSDVLSQMKLEPSSEQIAAQPVLRGGPVHTDRGFVLHRPGGQWDHTHKVSDTIQVTTSRDVLAAMARGEGPSDAFIALGYAGWESGQLEREMRENAWFSMPVNARVVFELPFEQGWPGALAPAARRFAAELERRFGLPVDMVDERYSSVEASAALKARRASGGRRRRIQREAIDSTAAAIILERWLAGEGQ